jgi:Tfp pilus assembly protein PilV
VVLEYLVAAVLGVAGMLALLNLAGDVVTLENRILQQTAAHTVLRELTALQRFAEYDPAEFQTLCESGPIQTLGQTCRSIDRWLMYLPDHYLAQRSDGVIELSWQQVDGALATLTSDPL